MIDLYTNPAKKTKLFLLAIALSTADWGCADDPWSTQVPPEPPTLAFDNLNCPADAEPTSHGLHLLATGNGKLSRYAFHAHEGPVGLMMLSQAQSCLELGDQPSAARRAKDLVTMWGPRIVADYRLQQARLSRAIDARDSASASQHAQTLQRLLEKLPPSPYFQWLNRFTHRQD